MTLPRLSRAFDSPYPLQMFEKSNTYMLRSKAERQAHLDLADACIEIGGGSKDFRGLLAHFLRTYIMTRKDGANLCHACHNDKCSNPKHLYWGTYGENRMDLLGTGWRRRAQPLTPEHKRKIGIATSSALRGKSKSAEHRAALSRATTKQWERRKGII